MKLRRLRDCLGASFELGSKSTPKCSEGFPLGQRPRPLRHEVHAEHVALEADAHPLLPVVLDGYDECQTGYLLPQRGDLTGDGGDLPGLRRPDGHRDLAELPSGVGIGALVHDSLRVEGGW